MLKGFVREGELRRWAPWLGAVLLILLAVALETSLESVCWDEDAARAAKINEAAGCLEFWFNRYQTLIGAVAALAAAGVAWIGVRRQIEKADEQITVASRQSAIAMLPAMDERTESMLKLHRLADTLNRCSLQMLLAASDAFEQSEKLRQAYATGNDLPNLIGGFASRVTEYQIQIGVYSQVFGEFIEEQNRGLGGPSFRAAGSNMWSGASEVLRAHEDAFKRLERCVGNRFSSDAEIKAGFSAIREFNQGRLSIPKHAFVDPLRVLADEVEVMQSERDRIFELSRG